MTVIIVNGVCGGRMRMIRKCTVKEGKTEASYFPRSFSFWFSVLPTHDDRKRNGDHSIFFVTPSLFIGWFFD
jgi:hypothetical protein